MTKIPVESTKLCNTLDLNFSEARKFNYMNWINISFTYFFNTQFKNKYKIKRIGTKSALI